MISTKFTFTEAILFLLGTFSSLLDRSSALDAATMTTLIRNKADSFEPYSVDDFMKLWAPEGKFCTEGGCFDGVESIEEVMSAYADTASLSCDERCYFLEAINKACCRYTCVASLKSNPGCVADGYDGNIVYEWNDDGLLVRLDDFFYFQDYVDSVEPCLNDDLEESKGAPDLDVDAAVIGDLIENYSAPRSYYFHAAYGLLIFAGLGAIIIVSIRDRRNDGYIGIET